MQQINISKMKYIILKKFHKKWHTGV